MLEERIEEILEALWTKEEEGEEQRAGEISQEEVEELLKRGWVKKVGVGVVLTKEGKGEARNIVRRHRLAERLLADVIDSHGRFIHERACRLEHLIDPDLEEDICTLLGHPPICPHGNAIPKGNCCLGKPHQVQPLVFPLPQLPPGHMARVAYIHTRQKDELQKLINMGIFPGTSLRLIQNFPSYVFELGRTQFAIDQAIAEAIYVRLEGKG